MDRRNLHKANNQKMGKSKQTSLRTRANNRAAHQDALRQLESEVVAVAAVPAVVKVSRIERLKQWRVERDEKKKKEELLKRKPFVTVVKRGVFTEKTNYAELNKQRRNKTATKKTNVSHTSTRNASGTSSSTAVSNIDFAAVRTDSHSDNTGLLAVPEEETPEPNTTFETQNSSQNVQNQPIQYAAASVADVMPSVEVNLEPTGNIRRSERNNLPSTPGVNTLAVPQNSSVLNSTFEMEDSSDNTRRSERNIEPNTSVVNLLAVPQNSSVLNTTFELEDTSENTRTSERNSVLNTPVVNLLSVPQNSSVLNTTFELEESSANNRASEVNGAENQSTLGVAPKPSTESTPRASLSTSFNYVSPFVTISRGKGSSRKEVKVRESFYKLELNNSVHDSPAVRRNRDAAEYFRFQVNNETTNLMQMIDDWTQYKNDNGHVDSVYLDQIDVAIGQTRLLINKKFKQFLGLCDECETGKSQPPVLPKDLEGFWSMVFMQVENCSQRFQKLTTLKANDWVEVDLIVSTKVPKQTKNRKIGKKGPSASSGIQKMIEEARLKMKENRITAASSSNGDVSRDYSMRLRQTPARLSVSSVTKTPRSILKAKTTWRGVRSVAFAESPSVSESPRVVPEPKPKVVKRRASIGGIPTEKSLSSATKGFLTPHNRKVSTDNGSTSSVRRSHRRLFSAAEK